MSIAKSAKNSLKPLTNAQRQKSWRQRRELYINLLEQTLESTKGELHVRTQKKR